MPASPKHKNRLKSAAFSLALCWLALTFPKRCAAQETLCAQDMVNQLVRMDCSPGYKPPGNMMAVDVALYVTGSAAHRSGEVLDFMRRYDDETHLAHPSVLANWHQPSHYVLAAADTTDFAKTCGMIQAHDRRGGARVLLYAGHEGRDKGFVKEALRCFDAVYSIPQESVSEIAAASGLQHIKPAEAALMALNTLCQAFFGAIELTGPAGTFQQKTRLEYPYLFTPEEVSLQDKIDEIAEKAISKKATPGLCVAVLKGGRVVCRRAYGHTTYKKTQKVTPRTIYDLASLTKVLGTLPVVMSLHQSRRLFPGMTIGNTLGAKLPVGNATVNISPAHSQITVGDLLLHTSGLPSGVPVFALCVDSSSFEPPLYRRKRDATHRKQITKTLYLNDAVTLNDYVAPAADSAHTVRVSRDCYASPAIEERIWRHVQAIRPGNKKYLYSDINFLYLQRICQKLLGHRIDTLWRDQIARPMGLRRTLYTPWHTYGLTDVAPTANDTYWRKEQIWTTPHDELASAMGGVAGNAGLFGSLDELARICQMYIDGGTYGGVRYFKPATVTEFTKRHTSKCRRGYGFDMPETKPGAKSPVPDSVPKTSFGHTGFSGTMVWMDPISRTALVFLSNRIYPDPENNQLNTLSIRSEMLEAIFK